MTLFADIDWPTVGTAAAAFGTAATTIGGAVKYLLDRASKERDAQRQHELKVLTDQRTHETAMVGEMKTLQTKFDTSLREIITETRKESRETVGTLLTMQRETVETVGELRQSIDKLSMRVDYLHRAEGGDEPPAGPPSGRHPRPGRPTGS